MESGRWRWPVGAAAVGALALASVTPAQAGDNAASPSTYKQVNLVSDVAGRAQITDPNGLTVHELRHTAASLAVSAGANVKTVQRLLGHASAAMTLDVYSGLFDDDLDAVAERLNESVVPPARPKATSMPTVFPDSAA